ncbi:MAG: hypothetical protein NUV65_06910 [Candidatus Roizmanbacteria bacterium]|nr:hypothetical protein [Candidatus Roizmanbacteria bacterium]
MVDVLNLRKEMEIMLEYKQISDVDITTGADLTYIQEITVVFDGGGFDVILTREPYRAPEGETKYYPDFRLNGKIQGKDRSVSVRLFYRGNTRKMIEAAVDIARIVLHNLLVDCDTETQKEVLRLQSGSWSGKWKMDF